MCSHYRQYRSVNNYFSPCSDIVESATCRLNSAVKWSIQNAILKKREKEAKAKAKVAKDKAEAKRLKPLLTAMMDAGVLRDQWLRIDCDKLLFATVDNVRFTITDQTDLQARQVLLQGQRCPLVGDQQDHEGHHATDLER